MSDCFYYIINYIYRCFTIRILFVHLYIIYSYLGNISKKNATPFAALHGKILIFLLAFALQSVVWNIKYAKMNNAGKELAKFIISEKNSAP